MHKMHKWLDVYDDDIYWLPGLTREPNLPEMARSTSASCDGSHGPLFTDND